MSKMTRQHFQLIADTLKASKPSGDTGAEVTWEGTVLRFADKLAETNPNFHRSQFLQACDMPEDLLDR